MIYRVIMDGNDILNFQEKPYILLQPNLEIELNTAGSFDFTMPPCHTFYDDIHPITSTIEVYEDEDLLWFGRPMEIKTDFLKNKQVYCEGALSFFNDTVQRPHEYDSIYVHEFFRTIISAHNTQVSPSRQFTVGNITVNNKKVYRNLRYESTFDVMKRQCLNSEGGYFFIRRENGINYIDWLTEMPYTTNQPVEFGLNLLDITSSFNGSSIVTCVLPLGEEDQETGEELTIASINNGSDIIESEAVSAYGRITKVVQFNGVRYPDTLYEDGLEYLGSNQFDDLVIECSAAELHAQNPNYEKFKVGQMVHCHSVPHLLDKAFPLLRISISLDSAAKKITLGSQKSQTLTEITKVDIESISQDIQEIGDLADETSWDLDHEVKPQIEAIYGIPDLDDFKNELSDLSKDWGDPDSWPEGVQDLMDRFSLSDSLGNAKDALSDLMAELMDKMAAEAEESGEGLPDGFEDLINRFKEGGTNGENALDELLKKMSARSAGNEQVIDWLKKLRIDYITQQDLAERMRSHQIAGEQDALDGDITDNLANLSQFKSDLGNLEALVKNMQDEKSGESQDADYENVRNNLTKTISDIGVLEGLFKRIRDGQGSGNQDSDYENIQAGIGEIGSDLDTLEMLLKKWMANQAGNQDTDYESILSNLAKLRSDLQKAEKPSSIYDMSKGISGLKESVSSVSGLVSGLSGSIGDVSASRQVATVQDGYSR